MAKKKEKATPKREVTKRRLARWQQERRRRRIIITAGTLVIALVLAIIGYGFYATVIAPGKELVTEVGDSSFYRSEYKDALVLCEIGFCPSSGNEREDPILYLENNELVRQGAAAANILITDTEITQGIKDTLFPDEEDIDDEVYKQILSNMGLSDQEYREVVKTGLIQTKLSEYFLEQVPEYADQIHVEAILVATEEEATEVMGNLSEGDDFASIAAKLGGGDLGWLPQGIMGGGFDDVAFNPDLALNTVHEPFSTADGYFIIRLLEQEEDRAIDDVIRDQLAAIAFSGWLDNERNSKVVRSWKYDQNNPEYVNNLDNLYQWALDEIG